MCGLLRDAVLVATRQLLENDPAYGADFGFSVDFVRVVAILLVILVHTAAFPYYLPQNITSDVVTNWFTVDVYGAVAAMGVPLFVMLSGALLLDPVKADEPMRVFYKKRFLRIGGPMIFWTIIYFWWSTIAMKETLTVNNVLSGLLSGSYPHMWFLYMLLGLYLVTPFLRAMLKNLDRNKFKYLLVLWFVGNVSVPFINQFAQFPFNPVMFVFTGWVGYYILGRYLVETKVAKWKPIAVLIPALVTTILGAWWVTGTFGEAKIGYFHEALNATVILASVSMFLLLAAIPKAKIECRNKTLTSVLHWIGQNTLPIYLFHMIIMQTIEKGYLGFFLNQDTLNPIIEIPILTAITFALTAAAVYLVKKIPYSKYVIG
jgi:surface polysaccharide O-acyltransferase-like enzyme